MKRLALAFLILLITLSCVAMIKTPPIGEAHFPLRQVLNFPVDGKIIGIAVGGTWIAVHTPDTVIAIDITSQKTLWSKAFHVNPYGRGFQIVGDVLVAASQEQIILVDKLGQEKEINLEVHGDDNDIVEIISLYPNYLYVVRGSKWLLETYDISGNMLKWDLPVGRDISDVIYSESDNIAYVMTTDSMRAFDSSSGLLLWEQPGYILRSTIDFKDLYLLERVGQQDNYKILSYDFQNQIVNWEKSITVPPSSGLYNLEIVGNLLIASGRDLIAVDKMTGEQVWETNIGEEFYISPIEFNGVLYLKGGVSRTIYAISISDGSIIGTANLEDEGLWAGVDTDTGVYKLNDGILFNTRNAIVIYKAK